MTSHSKSTVFEDDPDFNNALEELRVAWKGGKSASEGAEVKAKKTILKHGYTKKAAQAIMALKTTKTGAGTDFAAEQKYNILLTTGPTLLNEAEELMLGLNAMIQETAMSQNLWKVMMDNHRTSLDHLKQFDGYYADAEIGHSISTACALGELATSYKKPPSETFVTGIRAKSRISKLITAAEGKQVKEDWAYGYLFFSLQGISNVDKEAAAIANILEASVSTNSGKYFRKSFIGGIGDKLIDSENNRTELGRLVSNKVLASSNLEYTEFKAALQSLESEAVEEESGVQLERTLLYEPTSWVSSLQSEEPVDHKSIELSFFKDQPAQVLLNSALVIANAEVSKANEITRNILACKILLPIGRDFIVQGKSLSVPPTQAALLERIKQIANQPEVRETVEEYCKASLEEGGNTAAERLLFLYGEEEQGKVLSPAEVVDAFRTGKDTERARVDFDGHPIYVLLSSALDLSRVRLDVKNHELNQSRRDVVLSILSNIESGLVAKATSLAYADDTEENPLALVGHDRKNLEGIVKEIIAHPATKDGITDFISAELQKQEVSASDKSDMIDNIFSWYGDKTAVRVLISTARALTSTALSMTSNMEKYPQEEVHGLIARVMEANRNNEDRPWEGYWNKLVRDTRGWDPEFFQLVDLKKRVETSSVLSAELDELTILWNGMEFEDPLNEEAERLIEHCEEKMETSDSAIAERRARKVLPVLETTEDFGVVGHLANYLSNLNIHNNIVWNLEDKELVKSILEAAEKQSEKQEGPSNAGDRLYALKQSCEERIVRLSNFDELMVQLDDRNHSTAARSFGEIMKRLEDDKLTKDEAGAVLNRLEQGISTSTFNVLTEENLEKTKELCRDRLEQEEAETEPADLIHVPGVGLVTREELEAMEWKPLGSAEESEVELPELQEPEPEAAEEEEPDADEPIESEEVLESVEEILESVVIPEAKIFSVLEEAEGHLEDIASDELAMHEKALAVYELLKLLEIDEKSPQKLVLEIAALANDERSEELSTKAVAAMLSLPHVSDHNWSSRRNSSLLVSVLAAVPHNTSNQAMEEKLRYGVETEKDYVIDVLAERFRLYRGQFIDARLTPQGLALKELESDTLLHKDYAGLSRLVLAFSDMDVPQEILFHYLETSIEANPEGVEEVLLNTLNTYRSQMPGNLFPNASEEDYTKEEASLAENFLHYLGEGEDSMRELSIAAAVSNIDSKAALEFALQRLHDSEEEDHTSAWAVFLQYSKARETDKMIRDTSSALNPEKQAAAIIALAGRELTCKNAEFILEASHSKNTSVATAAERALTDMDLSEIPPENEFAILYGMRNHPNESLSGLAWERLQLFLSEAEVIPAEENIENLSNLHLHDADPVLRELAKECLMENPKDFLMNIETDHLLSCLGDETTQSTLSMYEIARQMRSGDADLESVSAAVEKFERDNNLVALTQLMTAAHASGEKEYFERVLVPCLGMDEIISQMAAEFLLNLEDIGTEVILTSAKRENHPDNISPERAKRIADKSLRLLLKIEAYDLVIPLLAYPYEAVRSSAYDMLEISPNSSKKTSAILAAFSSHENKVKLAALNLLPKQEPHLDRILSLVEDESKEVSVRAAEVAASLITPERLIVFLAHNHDSEFVRQRVADAILQNHPEKLDELSSYLEREDAVVLADRQTVLSTLRFFQHPKSLHQFFRFRGEADKAEMATIDNALSYFCETLSGARSGRIEEPTEDDMHLLLETYKRFDQDEVRNAILTASKGPSARIMLNAALSSNDPDLLLSATDIFLSVGKLDCAVQLARELRKVGLRGIDLPLGQPYQQIFFGGQLNKMEEILSPVEDPGADPIPYRFLKEMVTTEFFAGRGSNESAELFLEFVTTFGDMEGFFDHGLESISELLWASRADIDYDAVRKLPDRMPHDLVADGQLLLDVLVLGKYDLLDKTKTSAGVKNILIEHGLRRAVESLEGIWLKPDEEKEKSKQNFSLLAELMERGMVTEEDIRPLMDPHHPIVCALDASDNLWDEGTVNEGLEIIHEVLAGQSTARKLKKMREELGPMHADEVSPEKALADASKVVRSRVPSPARDGKPIQPKRPERGFSSLPPKK